MKMLDEFYRLLGEADCAAGIKAQENKPKAYYVGYAEQYAKEQQQSQGFN